MPTISTDGLLVTAMIDGHEERDVAPMDIPGAFLQAENDEFILMLLRRKVSRNDGTSRFRTLSEIYYHKSTRTADAICQVE